MFMGVVMNDFTKASQLSYDISGLSILLVSCVMGVGISYAGFNCQRVVSGTSYAIIGIMNKMLTILINLFIWDNHASNAGIGSLMLCVVGGIMYEQPPLVKQKQQSVDDGEGGEVTEALNGSVAESGSPRGRSQSPKSPRGRVEAGRETEV
jgi:GDP-mannose transporter